MASLFKRRKQYWVSFYLDGVHVRRSLRTTSERVARSKLKQIEYELAIGDLHVASRLPLPAILEAFCRYLMATRTYKSYKNDYSRLRVVFGPLCEELLIRPPGSPDRPRGRPQSDKYAGKHIQAELLEDVTPQTINRFLAAREEQDRWSPKTAMNPTPSEHLLWPDLNLILEVCQASPPSLWASKAEYIRSLIQPLEGAVRASGDLLRTFCGLDMERHLIDLNDRA